MWQYHAITLHKVVTTLLLDKVTKVHLHLHRELWKIGS